MAYEIVIHDCSDCEYDEPTRSCDWSAERAGAENEFATEQEAEAAIPELMATFEDEDATQYRVRVIGERWPL